MDDPQPRKCVLIYLFTNLIYLFTNLFTSAAVGETEVPPAGGESTGKKTVWIGKTVLQGIC